MTIGGHYWPCRPQGGTIQIPENHKVVTCTLLVVAWQGNPAQLITVIGDLPRDSPREMPLSYWDAGYYSGWGMARTTGSCVASWAIQAWQRTNHCSSAMAVMNQALTSFIYLGCDDLTGFMYIGGKCQFSTFRRTKKKINFYHL